MTPQELIAEFRNQVSDNAQPTLWSDDEVLRYMIDAQDMFVRRTGGIADMSTTQIVNVTVTLNTPFTAHSPYILRIMSGRLLTAKRDIYFVHESDIANLREEDYGSQLRFDLDDADVGEVRYGVLGLEEKKIRWLKVPEANDTCRLRVYRLPYPRLPSTWDEVTDETLEIDEQHHRHLLLWMKSLAYSKQDAETRDDKKAKENEEAFLRYCVQAGGEIERRRFKPRVVHYGGL
jgi:hypothetical protein